MWNCSAVITKNGSLRNGTMSLTTKNSYLQRYVATALKKRLFKTRVLTIEEHSCADQIGKCSLNRSLTASCNQTFRYTKATQKSIKDLSIRRFHTCLTAKCIADTKDILQPKSSHTCETSSSVVPDEPYSADDGTTTEKVPFQHAPEIHQSEKKLQRAEHNHFTSFRSSMKDIEKQYRHPKNQIDVIYSHVRNFKETNVHNFEYSQPSKTGWKCTLSVLWPEAMKFTVTSATKAAAAAGASYKCLHWLEANKRLNKGHPVLFTPDEIKSAKHRPVPFSVKEETLNEAQIIIDKYEENIQSIIQSNDHTLYIERNGYEEGAIIDPVGRSNPANRYEERIKQRNEILQKRFEYRMNQDHSTDDLPITNYRTEIIKAVEDNNVVVIKGDTGCGKTTQVPQFIMDSFIEGGQGTNCNLIISQPRRISAISLAERVATERNEQLGDVVGYQVRLGQALPNTPAGILFCTTGILLRKLQSNPTLEGCSHVIVDEAHERTIDTDMLLVLLKRAIQQRPDLKVVIMSATINAELFTRYFNCRLIEIPGRVYPVEMNFMEDIDGLGLRPANQRDLSFEDPEKESGGPTVDIMKMGELIAYITRNKPPGAILCFLPGWAEISKMKKYLEEYSLINAGQTLILPIHSKMSNQDQRKIFCKISPHIRKIVLATDIAETGITVADVVYVVDSCTHRQIQWQKDRGLSSIGNHWASQANILQRKGRAGRVKPGVSYHFINKQKFAELPKYQTPEVLRSALEKTVLDVKTYSSERAAEFLGKMPQPPQNSVISQAIQHLIRLGALDEEENLTPLGKRISLFTLNPELSKAIVYSSIFQCVSPIITIASLLSGEIQIFPGVLYEKSAIRSVKAIYHPTSDHVSLAWLFQQWYTIDKCSRTEARSFAEKSRVLHDKMYTLSKVREINADHLKFAKMLPEKSTMDQMSATENEYSELDELCRGVLLAGLDHVLYRRDFDIRNGQMKKGTTTFVMEDGNRATLTPESVNFKRDVWPSPYCTFASRTHSEIRRTSLIRETSMISPLTLFLFSQSKIKGYRHESTSDATTDGDEEQILFKLSDKKNVHMVCSKNTADVLLRFRDVMWSVVRYLVANHGVASDNMSDVEKVAGFRQEMNKVLGKMLTEASELIDNPPRKTPKYVKLDQGALPF